MKGYLQVTILRKLTGKIPGNPRKFPGIFRRNIGENVNSYSKESYNPAIPRNHMVWRIFVTHSEKILITLSKEFLITCNSRKFLVTNSAEKSSKMSTKFVENFQRKFVGTNSRDFPGNYTQDFLKSSSGILFEKSGTWKFCDEFLRSTPEFPEKYSGESLRNFLRRSPEKFSGISRNLFSYLIPLKICKLDDQVLRISQEFPEKHSREFLRNF